MSAASLDLQVGDRVVFMPPMPNTGDLWRGVIEKITQDESSDGEPMALVRMPGGGTVRAHLEAFEPEDSGEAPTCVWFQ